MGASSLRYGVLSLMAALALLACGKISEEFPADQVCRDVGYAISARTFECEADTALAEKRFEQFSSQYQCLVREVERTPIDVYYHCPAQITATTCEQVEAYGDDLLPYLLLSPTCRQFLAGPGLKGDDSGASGAAGAAGEGGSAGEAGEANSVGEAGEAGSGQGGQAQ